MRHALSLSEVRTRWAKELVRQFVGPNAKVCWIHRSNKVIRTNESTLNNAIEHGPNWTPNILLSQCDNS